MVGRAEGGYSHAEVFGAVDRVLEGALSETVDELLSEARSKKLAELEAELERLKEFIANRQLVIVRRADRTPQQSPGAGEEEGRKKSKKRPDIWFFGGSVVVELKKSESELEDAEKQVSGYVSEFFRDVAKVAIVTDGLKWVFYDVERGDGEVRLIKWGEYYADRDLFDAGSIEQAVRRREALYSAIKSAFKRAIGTKIFYKPDPESIYKLYYPLLSYVDDIKKAVEENGVDGRAIYASYREIMTKLYAGLDDEEMLELFATHTLLQAIVNAILTMVLGKDVGDPVRACAGEPLRPLEVALPHLLWWRDLLGRPGVGALFEDVCESVVSVAYLFDWSYETGLDVFSHLYQDFVDRKFRYKIGEYYTPWWLVELILERLERRGAPARDGVVLDPACGSGRFLVSAFRRKLERGADPDAAYFSVVGIDLNPLAVSIARAELMMAYKQATRNDPPGTPLVFWGDSLGPHIGHKAELFEELKEVSDKLQVIAWSTVYGSPAKGSSKVEALKAVGFLESLMSLALEGLSGGAAAEDVRAEVRRACSGIEGGPRRWACEMAEKALEDDALVGKLRELVKKYRNGVWALPIVSNLFITLMESGGEFRPDIVVTNPPWLELNEIPRSDWGVKVRDYVRERYIKEANLPGQVGQKGDVSLVFLDLALSLVPKGGYVGIVLPAEQTYSGSASSHGVGKLLADAIFKRYGCEGEVIYAGDVFKHGQHASVAILKRGGGRA